MNWSAAKAGDVSWWYCPYYLIQLFIPVPIAAAMTEKPTLGEARAPWFFLWIQQMLKWGNPFLFGVLISFGMLVLVALLPYMFPKPAAGDIGQWFPKSNRLAQIVIGVIAVIVLVLLF